MKKLFVLAELLGLFLAAAFSLATADDELGFKEDWSVDAKTFDLHAYEGIAIDKIDLKDINIRIIDDEGDVTKGRIGDETWISLAHDLYEAFAENLKTIVPLIESDEKEPGQDQDTKTHALNFNIKVSGTFEHEDQRLLMQMIKGKTPVNKSVPLTIECELIDRQAQKTVAKFSASSEFSTADVQRPFTTPEEVEQFKALADVWAGWVVKILNAGEKK